MEYHNLCYGCFEDKENQVSCPRCGLHEETEPGSLLHLPPGTVLQGKYLLGRVLGQGGFGITYLAFDTTLNLKLAIKEYLPQQLATRSGGEKTVTVFKKSLAEEFNYGMTKFLEEARTLARFNEHPNIVTVRDYFEANNTAYLVMNCHEGVTLQSYLVSKGGKIPAEQAYKIFMPVLDALKEVHAAGILHRDISPDNLLIDRNGRVILIDFGAARQAMGEKSKSLSVIMKAGYSPPEQYQSRGKQGPWTDIYAVAATMYRAITGQAPLEAIDRMAEDDLQLPSQLGVKIDIPLEETLLKALAVRAKDRYQAVEDFQGELVAASDKDRPGESYDGVRTKKTGEPVKEKIEDSEESVKEKAKEGFQTEEVNEPKKKPGFAQQPTGRAQKDASSFVKLIVIPGALVIFIGLLFFGAVSLFGGVDDAANPALADPVDLNNEDGAHEAEQTFAPEVIAGLDADYYIDYTGGTIPLGDLPIGARVVDPSWEWEFRTGRDYTFEAGDETKPVTWLVVAKDHYNLEEPHLTLLSEELVAFHVFDNSSNRDSEWGSNHWGENGRGDGDYALRLWLNSTGIHSDVGFYNAFSESFNQIVLATELPNREWEKGNEYFTNDNVFIPSTTELGDNKHDYTYPVGSTFSYFEGSYNSDRMATLENQNQYYWTRSPSMEHNFCLITIDFYGKFYFYSFECAGRVDRAFALRPALNIKAETMVSIIKPANSTAQNDSLRSSQFVDTFGVSDLNADFYFDQENGSVSLEELPVGTRIVDPAWEWEFRWGVNYSDYDRAGELIGPGESKPVTWLIVAKDHYNMTEPHVTLISEELIALHVFDNSTNRGSESGSNHWGDSGTSNASLGLRPWLNSTGSHSDEGFYNAFSESFKKGVITTLVLNREWENGDEYYTEDKVFIPSFAEMGISKEPLFALPIGERYSYFTKAGDASHDALLNGIPGLYWQRSPSKGRCGPKGNLRISIVGTDASLVPSNEWIGVRPVLNFKADSMLSAITY